MRFLVIAAIVMILALPAFPTGVCASARVLKETNGNLVVEVSFPASRRADKPQILLEPGRPRLRYERVLVAVPQGGTVDVRLGDASSRIERGSLPALNKDEGSGKRAEASSKADGFFPAQPFVVSGPFVFRKTAVVAIDCFESQVDYNRGLHRLWDRYELHVSYPTISLATTPEDADPILARLVINSRFLPVVESQARSARARPVPDPHFSRSPNWVKLTVTSPGVYGIRGSDLQQIGVSLGSINDPNSFRLFTGGGRQIARDLAGPGGTYMPGNWMRECDIVVEYGADGSFDLGDRIIFYGLGIEGWADLYEPGSPRETFTDHLHAKENFYFLTWDSSFPGSPRRVASVSATPTADPDILTFEERLYFERDGVQDYTFGGDGWLWLNVPPGSGPDTFDFPDFLVVGLDTLQAQTFRTVALAKFRGGGNNRDHRARYLVNGSIIGEKVWDTFFSDRYDQGQPVELTGFFLREGNNDFRLNVPRVPPNTTDFMYFAWYSVFYHRKLEANADALSFSSPDTSGVINLGIGGFTGADSIYVFDVTDQFRPLALVGASEMVNGGLRSVRLSSNVGGGHNYYWASTSSALKRLGPATMARHFPRDLRNVATSPNMVIVTHPAFAGVAESLRRHRETNLPLYPSPVVNTVTTTEVFDNFSGGVTDPMAIRNYCKFLYDNFTDPGGGPALAYLLLLGDANADSKNVASTQPNFVATNLNLNPFELDAYITDDHFGYMDSTDVTGKSLLDLAVGRLPAASFNEALFLVNRVIDYEVRAEFGSWRNRILLVADDENSTFTQVQDSFIIVSELIAAAVIPEYLDPRKLYLTEFPAIQGVKPSGRVRFISDWNDGVLVINWVGHGSSVQIADEQVFLASDVTNLRNGLRLPLFIGMSCTIGDFGEVAKSLSERLLLREGGGVIATVTASELTFINQNDELDINLFNSIFPTTTGPPAPMGVALMTAKVNALARTLPAGSRRIEENSQKYNLLGDPALQLNSPRRSIQLVATDVDTMTTGTRETVRGTVYNNGQPDTGFNGVVELVVREPDDASGYSKGDTFFVAYRYPAGTVYQGTADVTAGDFEFSFKIPRFAQSGSNAFVNAYANDGAIDGALRNDDIFFVRPSPGDSTALRPSDGPPRIDFGFQGAQRTVKPGAVLQAIVRDADGINILNTTPEGKLALVFDEADLPLDVTEFFDFDHGGVDTSGTLRFPLPELVVGPHRAVLKVSDTFGQTTLDTLDFAVTDPLDYSASIVFNYPNPFVSSTHFMLNLTDPASIRLDIFTVGGNRIRTIEERKDRGEQWVFWDGKDATGSSIANGTYLYVARVRFEGVDRPALVLRGKVVKIE